MTVLQHLPPLEDSSIGQLSRLIFGSGVDPEVHRLMRREIAGKRVLVTGAGGSIGGSLCRRLRSLDPAAVAMLDISEHGLYQTHKAIEWDERFVTLMGDIRDEVKIAALFEDVRPQVVIHAAALKHVPMLENPHNLIEAVRTNVVGTHVVAREAKASSARFVLVSTDKAVNPSSILGLTKRVAERVVSTFHGGCATHSIVRFGNVMNSSGSAIPLFREQIARGGPVTITDQRMTRYMMTLSQAVDLVLASLALGSCLSVLQMGDPIRIIDLARMLIRMADKEPGEDVEIKEIGIRPGEKLDEELFYADEELLLTSCPVPGITMVGLTPHQDPSLLMELLHYSGHNAAYLRRLLCRIEPTYSGSFQ